MKVINKLFVLLIKNKEWLFSGIGITIVTILFTFFSRFVNNKSYNTSNTVPIQNIIEINGDVDGDIYQNSNINAPTTTDIVEVEDVNSIIENLYLGESKRNIENILGIPRFEFPDDELSNSFYSLDQVVLRFVFDKNELLVGYFVTAKYDDSKIKISGPLSNGELITFGENTFDPESYPDAVISGLAGMGGSAAINTYYWEYSYMYGVGLYKTYVAAIFPYGFTEPDSYDLISLAAIESVESPEIFNLRKTLHPNTIGMLDSNYVDIIKPYMPNKDNAILWIECMMKLIEDVQDI